MSMVYLDNNATTAIHPRVAAAMAHCYEARFFNPASQHYEGRRARRMLEKAREGIGLILGAQLDHVPTDRIIFTSGGTEANNLAIRGLRSKSTQRAPTAPGEQLPQRIIVSSIEHPSVLETATALSQSPSTEVHLAPVDDQGTLDLDALRSLLTPTTRCVSLMLGNNETGALQPLDAVVEACRPLQIPVHTDAVQAVGKIPVSFGQLGVAALTATAHKFHGPRGIGVLMVRADVEIEPLLHGGSQQLGTRPGTESVALATGMWQALELWKSDHVAIQQRMQRLRDRLQGHLIAQIPDLVINSRDTERLPHTLNVSFPGLDRQALLLALDQAGLACSTGSACESGSSQPSHVLTAMNAPKSVVEGSIRLSLSADTTEADIDTAGEILVSTSHRLIALT